MTQRPRGNSYAAGDNYFVIKRSHAFYARPRFGSSPIYKWRVHWLHLFIGICEPTTEWERKHNVQTTR